MEHIVWQEIQWNFAQLDSAFKYEWSVLPIEGHIEKKNKFGQHFLHSQSKYIKKKAPKPFQFTCHQSAKKEIEEEEE